MRHIAIIGSILFSTLPAFAQFEGVIEMKITAAQMSGDSTLHLGKQGMRMKMHMGMKGGGAIDVDTLSKFSEPTLVYQLNDESKTYSVLDTSKGAQPKHKDGDYTVKKLGQEKIAGYTCEHVQVIDAQGHEFELWTSKEVAGADNWQRMMGQRANVGSQNTEGMLAALKKQKVDGFMAKMVAKEITVELIKAEKKSVPASMFEIPSGYTKQEGGAANVKLPPGAQQQMDEAMKNMTPEQREMVRKQMGGK